MSTNKFLKFSVIFSLAVTLLAVTVFIPAASAANFPLEIIQPRAGLNTSNRYYKAYPGLEYNVRMAVIGGEYPYAYELTTAPAGMTIDPSTGKIVWENPTTTGSPHQVTVQVTDIESTRQSVTWTISVTTSGFRFIDAVNGTLTSNGGTGTINNPWKSLRDMYEGNNYESKRRNSFAGAFLYLLNGTYSTSDIYVEDTHYVPFIENRKPQVWLAYPGHSPVINIVPTLYVYSGGSNLYFDGLTFNTANSTRKIGIRISSRASNVVFRRNTFNGGGMVGTTGRNNSLLFIENDGKGSYWSIQENRGSNVTGDGYWLLGYSANKVLVENNVVSNVSGHSIGPKMNTSRWFIRGNAIENGNGHGINVMYYSTSENIEISYNKIMMNSGYGVRLNQEDVATGGSVYVERNNINGNIRVQTVNSTNGPFSISENIIINSTGGDKITKSNINYQSNLIISNNLAGSSSDNIINSEGLLTSNYQHYLGSRGWQFADGSTPIDGTYSPVVVHAVPENLRMQ